MTVVVVAVALMDVVVAVAIFTCSTVTVSDVATDKRILGRCQ